MNRKGLGDQGVRVAFDHPLKLELHGAAVTSDVGLLAFRELDAAIGPTALAARDRHWLSGNTDDPITTPLALCLTAS